MLYFSSSQKHNNIEIEKAEKLVAVWCQGKELSEAGNFYRYLSVSLRLMLLLLKDLILMISNNGREEISRTLIPDIVLFLKFPLELTHYFVLLGSAAIFFLEFSWVLHRLFKFIELFIIISCW